jgi:hypothetical protein
LCHDLGRLALGECASAYIDLADPLTFQEHTALLAEEKSLLGVDHCAFGGWYAHLHELPEPVIRAIQYHHLPELTPSCRLLVALAALADDMANQLLREDRPMVYEPRRSAGWANLAGLQSGLALPNDKTWVVSLMVEVDRQVSRVLQSLGSSCANEVVVS